MTRCLPTYTAIVLLLWAGTSLAFAGPMPTGTSNVSVSYVTNTGTATFNGPRDFGGSGPGDATDLGAAPNVRAFNSVNTFGRRMELQTNPLLPASLDSANESLITHSFFKIDNGGNFFPDLAPNGQVTIEIDAIHFDQVVSVDLDTLMLHAKWNDQRFDLDEPYIWTDNHHTATASFRNIDAFLQGGSFSDLPSPNYVLDDAALTVAISGNGTDTLGLSVSFPYEMLMNLEEAGQNTPVPAGLPAPQGFLEPFHFHIEYVVTPEPTSLALLAAGTWVMTRRRRKR